MEKVLACLRYVHIATVLGNAVWYTVFLRVLFPEMEIYHTLPRAGLLQVIAAQIYIELAAFRT